MVAQVDEQHAAMVADAVAPAGQADGFADMGFAEIAAGMGAIGVHGGPLQVLQSRKWIWVRLSGKTGRREGGAVFPKLL